jgi:rhodanese-related sulfurtransferase
MKRKIWVTFVVGLLLLTACAGNSAKPALNVSSQPIPGQKVAVAGGEYTNLAVKELQEMMQSKDFVFVNVHIPFEGRIANTDLEIPYNEIDQKLGQLPAEKDARIVLYCRSGHMSKIAAETLVSLGYTNVASLDGGMLAWEQSGQTIEGK